MQNIRSGRIPSSILSPQICCLKFYPPAPVKCVYPNWIVFILERLMFRWTNSFSGCPVPCSAKHLPLPLVFVWFAYMHSHPSLVVCLLSRRPRMTLNTQCQDHNWILIVVVSLDLHLQLFTFGLFHHQFIILIRRLETATYRAGPRLISTYPLLYNNTCLVQLHNESLITCWINLTESPLAGTSIPDYLGRDSSTIHPSIHPLDVHTI